MPTSTLTTLGHSLAGEYRSAIVLHNPNDQYADLELTLAFAFPSGSLAAGPVATVPPCGWPPNQSIEVDCSEIPGEFIEEAGARRLDIRALAACAVCLPA